MRFHESYLNLLKSQVKLKIIEFLLSHEASMSEREIASILKISHMSVNRIMQELAEMNLVSYAVIGKAHLWKVNRKSFAYKVVEQLIGKLKAMPDPLLELKRLIMRHLLRSLIKRVVLFGSIVRNTERADSDIDLFILVKNIKDQNNLEKSIEKLSNACLDIFGNRLAPYVLTEKQYKEKQGLSVIAEINKGIQLYSDGRFNRDTKIQDERCE